MADHYANIDLVFRNGLKDFEVLPPQDLWEGIAPSVRKSGRRLAWQRAAAVAAVTITTGIILYSLSHNLSGILNGPAITLNQDSRPDGKFIPASTAVRPAVVPSEIASSEKNTGSANMLSGNTPPSFAFTMPDALSISTAESSQKSLSYRNNRLLPDNSSVKSKALVPYNKDIDISYYVPQENTASPSRYRWSVGAMVSPTYYSMFDANKSDQTKNLTSSEAAAMSYTGGVSFAYNVNKRISLQMGLYYSSLNHEIDGVQSYSGFTAFYAIKGSDNFTIQTANGTITSENNDIFLRNGRNADKVTSIFTSDVIDPNKAGLNYLSSSVHQNFNYLEVPFIIRYKVIARTLGMNVIGGFSYNQLLNNSAYAVSDGNKIFIGSTDGLYPITLSSSIGVGMEYSLSKKVSINLEPTFRYYLTPMSGQGGSSLHPYTFGIFSGVSYKF
jgi:hypothetical protein